MAREHVNRAVAKQEKAEKNLEQNKPSQAFKDQQEAAQELLKALQQLDQDPKKEQDKKSSGQEKDSQNGDTGQQEQQTSEESSGEKGEEISPTAGIPAEVSPDDIINEELDNKKIRSVKGASGYKPVEKDW